MDNWKERLTPEQYAVMREGGTEAPFSSELNENKETGMYHCAACGAALFSSTEKFDSGTGWPSFTKAVNEEIIETRSDDSAGMRLPAPVRALHAGGQAGRTEVLCAHCGSHLGHIFPDGPTETQEGQAHTATGERLCINGCALDFQEGDGN